MPYEIKKGKKHFTDQPEYEFPGCNCELLKKHETDTKVFPKGWRMSVGHETLNEWIKDKKAKAYSHAEPTEVKENINLKEE